MSKHRSIVFTLNNPVDDDFNRLRSLVSNGAVEYIRFQEEIAPTTGTHHLQGWAQARSPRTFASWKTHLGRADVHVEKRRGSVEENERYCSKADCRAPGTLSESFGVCPQQGERTDLAAITAAALDLTVPWREVALVDPEQFVRSCRGLRELRLSQVTSRCEPTRCFWFYGETGCGKSRFVEHLCSAEGTYWKTGGGNNKWFDGYDPVEHPDVVIDDFRPSMSEFSFLLRLCDRYPLVVENKGSYYPFRASRLFFTTPKAVKSTWKTVSDENLDQLERRLVTVCHFLRHDGRLFIRVVRGGDVEELRQLPDWIEPFSNLDPLTQAMLIDREERRSPEDGAFAGHFERP